MPTSNDDSDVVAAYLQSWSEGGAEASRANDTLDDLVRLEPERAWPIVRQLIASAPSPTIIAIIAAGPLEDLLCTHGTDFVDRVIEEAQKSPKFREALRAVWGETRMNPDVYRMIRAIAPRH